MPRKAKSKPTKPAQPTAAQWNQRAKLVEEFAALEQTVSNFKPTIFRHEKLRQLILDWFPHSAPEDEILVSGVNCDIVITSRDKVRSVSPEGKTKLYRLWGAKDFIARSQVLLKALPDPKDEAGLYTVQSLTGPRHLRVVSKPRAAAETAA